MICMHHTVGVRVLILFHLRLVWRVEIDADGFYGLGEVYKVNKYMFI